MIRPSAFLAPRLCGYEIPLWAVGAALFGLLSLYAGQDANWDLQNYHVYNPWAYLTNRTGTDLAPAGIQSYFNPLLDIPYYWMSKYLWPPATGFIMGCLHGLNFGLLLAIARLLLPTDTKTHVVVLLALGGCLAPTFLSELGNTMGDNTTALLNLGALYLILKSWKTLESDWRSGLGICFLAALLVGMGAGLKLTNAIYAVGIFVSLLCLRLPLPQRLAVTTIFGLGVLFGMAVTGGFWYLTMWQHFGNPVFPMFNSVFRSELFEQSSLRDTSWMPRSIVEAIFYPYVVAVSPQRMGEIKLTLWLWPISYTLLWVWFFRNLLRKISGARSNRAEGLPATGESHGIRPFLIFLATSYFTWMLLFSIGRYAVSIEMLLPIACWLAFRALVGPTKANRFVPMMLVFSMLVTLVRFETWGHAPWSSESYAVEVPKISQPDSSMVLLIGPPFAWITPAFPEQLVFVSLTEISQSKVFWERAESLVDSRPGGLYAIVQGRVDARAHRLSRLNRWLQRNQIRTGSTACKLVTRYINRTTELAGAVIPRVKQNSSDVTCEFQLYPQRQQELESENTTLLEGASKTAESRGFSINAGSCILQKAFIGAKGYAYQFCRVEKRKIESG
ncbi:MAG: hypothetical protein V4562_02535 [Pseudomonadota bacterium]